ncbi:serine hydrolase domain-containing protein [Glycomyces harbinensis]|uniref:D-alanyl-D-alanine carboxypeptidase n=1 Tax=Glycomyces harbinensis TaxID=58114 RepID=A0A1G6ZSS7_9ACTN|nr:serine hydrolase domain-containing protein [Glycomyces harbinensis]SDE05453.1 D-alanyl-D-alanine carboxypeptidase [Glycomyces harbinensis]
MALTTALVLAAAPAAAAHCPDPALDADLLDARLEAFADVGEYSVVAEVRDGDETWAEAVGTRAFDDPRLAEPGDRVGIASVTKSMTAAILLQLEAEGEIDLDDTVGDHLPGLLPYENEPTIRQIMQHRGGLDEFLRYLYPSLAEDDLSDVREHYRTHYEPEELIALGTQGPLLFTPGDGWSYSNTGYMALGLLIEELTGDTLREVMDERVFEPAGMDDAYLPRDDTSGFHGPHLTPYVSTGEADEPYMDTTELSTTQLWAGGGVVADVSDVNEFYRAVFDGTLLDADQLAEATRFEDTGGDDRYGLGLFAKTLPCGDEIYVGHTGDTLGHSTSSFHSSDGQRQITVTWNIDDRHDYFDEDAFDAALEGLLSAALCE